MAHLEQTHAVDPEVQGSCFNATLLEAAKGKTTYRDRPFSLSLFRKDSSQVRTGQTCMAEEVNGEKHVLLSSTLRLFWG